MNYLFWILTLLLPVTFMTAAVATGPTPTTPATAAASSSDSSRAVGLGSGSPSANACQAVFLFGFSYSVPTCQLQQWAAILGANPTPLQMALACQDEMLAELQMCEKYRKKPAK